MDVVYERCCGLDIHKRTIVACVIVPGAGGKPSTQIRTLGTMTEEVVQLADGLTPHHVTQVAMESTGVYGKPIWNLVEGSFELVLVNAQRIKGVPGRKTDGRDAEWIADLLRQGLLQPRLVPARAQRELRELTRSRTRLIQERTAEVHRLQKTLEGAKIKLARVATASMGTAGRQILAALVAGATEAAARAALAQGRLREQLPQLEQALTGRVSAHQRFLLAHQLAPIDFLDATIERVSTELAERLRPFERMVDHLDRIPGVGRRSAEILLAEIGTDMRRFPRAHHLARWAGMGPGKHERAGTRRSGKTRRGRRWLRWALIEVAQAAGRRKATDVGAHYRRLTARLGKKNARVAVGHTIRVIAYHVLVRNEPYRDLGGDLPGRAQPSSGRATIGAPTGRVGVPRQARVGCLIYHIFMAR